jgi:hypothetical protein
VRGVAVLEVLEDDARLPEDEFAVDEGRHLAAGIETEILREAVLAAVEAEGPQLVGELLVLEREPDLPGVGRTGAVVQREGHARSYTPITARADGELRW